ncbi:hypothetical protein ABID16_002554 [Rhizobium aquaticum]|uniref:Tetracyclin repressor-like C-terminal domain-containing protein n=1 Tax=Rhizobium aquaticum TaxID=1549636 RepID=A0ABV2J0E5_9HYPH
MRVRIIVEFAYIVGELVIEEDRIPRDMLFRQVDLLFDGILEKLIIPET